MIMTVVFETMVKVAPESYFRIVDSTHPALITGPGATSL